MNIYVMRDGQKVGPFSDEAIRVMLEQGELDPDDLACRRGASIWEPLGKVLASPAAEPVEPPPGGSTEPATAAQIAFLSYFGLAIPAGLLKEVAAKLITTATEDPKNAKRLTMWEVDRLHLHPDLFVAEAQAKKENRAHFYFDLCQTAGSDYFTGVTKAHCQVLVAFLDVKFPRWDSKEAEATEKYFFPAIAEKFPQLVNKTWRDRLRYGEGPVAAKAKAARKSPTSRLSRRPDSPLRAMARGFVLGLCILAVLYVVHRTMRGGKWQLPKFGGDAKTAAVEGALRERFSAPLSSASRAGG
jgi:hypothetical protein